LKDLRGGGGGVKFVWYVLDCPQSEGGGAIWRRRSYLEREEL